MSAYCGIRKGESASASPVPEYTWVMNTWVVAVGIHEKNLPHVSHDDTYTKAVTYIVTKRSTLSSSLMNPIFTNPFTINTPNIGDTINLPTAIDAIAPTGSELIVLGTLSFARAAPRQTKPSGTDAAPRKLAVSRMKYNGGLPSGALGIGLFSISTNKALRGFTSAMGNASAIVIVAGARSECRKLRAYGNRILDFLDDDEEFASASAAGFGLSWGGKKPSVCFSVMIIVVVGDSIDMSLPPYVDAPGETRGPLPFSSTKPSSSNRGKDESRRWW